MQRRLQYGFNILIPTANAVRVSGENLNISCIMAVPTVQHQPLLVLNLSENYRQGYVPGVDEFWVIFTNHPTGNLEVGSLQVPCPGV